MSITAIAVFNLRTDSTTTFSRVDIAGEPGDQECALLRRFYKFLNSNRDANYLHWNMGTVEFGFEAIARRFQYIF